MTFNQFPARFGKYILLDRVNSGGMAEVYRAKVTGAERFQRLVAIKCMLPQLNEDEQFTTMFIDEAKLAAQLSHANIVQIYELGRINENLYIVMELVNGRDLRHIIKRAGAANTPVPASFAAYVIAKAAEALDFAHRKVGMDGRPLNLVHRDVSPQNILVSYDGEVKVVDFGIAKAEVRDTETRAGVLKGKFAYMAPEQVMGGEIDRRADIFALGTVMYETLTGRKLFRGESDFSILEKVRAAEVPSVSASFPNVPAEVDTILQKALTREKEERYAWASDLSEELAPLLIDNRTIFGTKQARSFMQALYADDIEQLAQQSKTYAEITEQDCVENSQQKKEPKSAEVFESDFSTLDDPLEALKKKQGEEEQPGTQLSQKREAPQAPLEAAAASLGSDWDGAKSGGGFGRDLAEDGTALFEGGPKRESTPLPARADALAETNRQPSLRPVRLEAMGSAPASGMRSSAALQPQPVIAPPTSSMAKPLLVGLLSATALVLVAVVAAIWIRAPSKTTVTTVAVPIDAAPPAPFANPGSQGIPPAPEPPPTTVVVGSGVGTPLPTDPTPAPAPPAVDPAPAPATPGEAGPGEDGEDEDEGAAKDKKGKRVVKFGYISIKATGVKTAKVFIDNKDVGYSPLINHKLKLGKHRIKVVEEQAGSLGKSKVLDILVGANNTRKDPLKLMVTIEP